MKRVFIALTAVAFLLAGSFLSPVPTTAAPQFRCSYGWFENGYGTGYTIKQAEDAAMLDARSNCTGNGGVPGFIWITGGGGGQFGVLRWATARVCCMSHMDD